ncbi:GGGtGRT protein [Clostridium cadaveris]|nr:GGGtGRT protein [Clostridium cadaveris]MDM8311437.1 GGGtGRT protein [Clostridium cadaveris]
MQLKFSPIYMGNNPMVGATVAVAVAVEEGMNK